MTYGLLLGNIFLENKLNIYIESLGEEYTVEVIIEVADNNDNAPVFPRDPLYVGIAPDIKHNDFIATLQVHEQMLC